MRRWAAACQRLVVPSATQLTRAQALLGIDPARCVQLPNGFDPLRFARRSVDRMALWHRLLVERPQGWGPGSEPGSVRYPPHVLGPFAQGPVPPNDERALAAALVAAVNDAPERRRRGIAASAAVHTRYSWPMLGTRLACAYEALLGRPHVT